MLSDLVADDRRLHPQYWLCRSDDHSRFAYARVSDFYRVSDGLLWAHLSHGWLVSARSGRRLARQTGSVFYDTTTNEPVYYYDVSY
jgi:hypothetical protein